jgi:23S rRNA (cytosine1962-C5)-methyltransferase
MKARLWTRLLFNRISAAINSRKIYTELINSNAMRLVHGESDGIPGLIVDKYDDVVTVQFLTAGVEFWKAEIVDAILKLTGAKVLYERSDMDVRTLEGLSM